ncbi:DUF3710 domain-containing protein [Nocardioides panaciterrulae]|uniref:DUF3710 domain-containing protein n=1 Tax=Nocardioides panaciterrulae TaxID=661492 RepID=A0A7Y9E690_9ACTN|nr:hypothetical protein [Nocardioides panaciterrulae]
MKFRRKSTEPGADEFEGALEDVVADDQGPGQARPADVEELAHDDDVERLDLGSLLIEPEAARELRLQVDESTGEVQAVMLAGPDGAVEVRAFAAPRHGDLWSTVRPQIAAEMAQRGGTASEREGRFGTELVCQLPVQMEDGSSATQPSRIIGINGPRWMLRCTLLGRPALEADGAQAWEESILKIVVRRGDGAMPVGDPLPVVLPPDARRVDPPTA